MPPPTTPPPPPITTTIPMTITMTMMMLMMLMTTATTARAAAAAAAAAAATSTGKTNHNRKLSDITALVRILDRANTLVRGNDNRNDADDVVPTNHYLHTITPYAKGAFHLFNREDVKKVAQLGREHRPTCECVARRTLRDQFLTRVTVQLT